MIIDAKCKKCRAYGQKLFLKGDRCFSNKCAMNKRPFPPGGTKAKRQYKKNMSIFHIQLFEKQKIKLWYCLSEKQLRIFYTISIKQKGSTPDNLAKNLEKRMDNVVFHLGFTKSKYSAHQAVNHGMFLLNGKKHNIGSTILKTGDVISIRDNKHKAFKNLDERLKDVSTPSWLELNKKEYKGTVKTEPNITELNLPYDFHSIIEAYSK